MHVIQINVCSLHIVDECLMFTGFTVYVNVGCMHVIRKEYMLMECDTK